MTPSSSSPNRYGDASTVPAVSSPISGPETCWRNARQNLWSISCAASRRQPSGAQCLVTLARKSSTAGFEWFSCGSESSPANLAYAPSSQLPVIEYQLRYGELADSHAPTTSG